MLAATSPRQGAGAAQRTVFAMRAAAPDRRTGHTGNATGRIKDAGGSGAVQFRLSRRARPLSPRLWRASIAARMRMKVSVDGAFPVGRRARTACVRLRSHGAQHGHRPSGGGQPSPEFRRRHCSPVTALWLLTSLMPPCSPARAEGCDSAGMSPGLEMGLALTSRTVSTWKLVLGALRAGTGSGRCGASLSPWPIPDNPA